MFKRNMMLFLLASLMAFRFVFPSYASDVPAYGAPYSKESGSASGSSFLSDGVLGSEASFSAGDMRKIEKLEENYDEKASGKRDVLRERSNLLNRKGVIQQNIRWFENMEKAFAFCIDKYGEVIVGMHNTLFGVSGSGGPSLKERLSGYYSGNVFSWFLTLFIILQCFIFAIRIVRGNKFQYAEIAGFGMKIALVLIVFYFIPFLPKTLINIAFTAAEKISGGETGELGFVTPLAGLSPVGSMAGRRAINALMASFVEAGLGVEAGLTAELTVSGHALYIVSLLLMLLCFIGMATAFLNCIFLFLRALYFFVGNIVLVVVLPSVVFSGYSESKTAIGEIAEVYFFNFTELFISGVVVLAGSRVFENIGNLSEKPLPVCLGLIVGVPFMEWFLLRETRNVVKNLKGDSSLIRSADFLRRLVLRG